LTWNWRRFKIFTTESTEKTEKGKKRRRPTPLS
jgi:hypothetical protein